MKHLLIAAVLLAATSAAAETIDKVGMAWLERIDMAEQLPHAIGEIEQTIVTSSGATRVLRARSWSAEGGDLSLMLYTEPPRVRGDKILMREGGEQIWYYMKRRDVTRHFTGNSRRQKAMGSDFSYQDLSQGKLSEDYRARLLGREELDGVECVKLECVPTDSGPSYERIILWACIDDALSRRIDFYDEKGLLKRLLVSDFRETDGRLLPFRYEMSNLREGSSTVMVQLSLDLETAPDSGLFTQAALARELR